MSAEENKDPYHGHHSFNLAVGARVRKIRRLKRMTQSALAIDCGLPYSQINRIELGKVDCGLSYLPLIAKVLKVNPRELLPPDYFASLLD